jgi:hypothetical protein
MLDTNINGTVHFKNCKQLIECHINSDLETSGGQDSNLFLNGVNFLTPVLIRHLWQLKTVVSLHRCLICAILLMGLKVWCYSWPID